MSHHDDTQPFKICAWPLIDHESTANSSRTWLLWPLIYHSRESDGTVTFRINPLLLSIHKRRDHHLTIHLLFYCFYLNIVWNRFTTIFFLPLLTFVKVRRDRLWQRIVLVGGLLFYGMFEQGNRKMVIPPLLFYSRTTK